MYDFQENARRLCFAMGLKMRYLNLKAADQKCPHVGYPRHSRSWIWPSWRVIFRAWKMGLGGLYFRKMKHDPLKPHWHERDYFVNSESHSAPGFFATLAVAGYFPISEMDTLRTAWCQVTRSIL